MLSLKFIERNFEFTNMHGSNFRGRGDLTVSSSLLVLLENPGKFINKEIREG